MIDPAFAPFIFAVGALVGVAIQSGIERRTIRRLRRDREELLGGYQELTKQLQADPYRLAIDTGKEYVLMELETLVERVRRRSP